MNEEILEFAKSKIAFCAATSNKCAHNHNLYQAGVKSGAVTALILILNKLGHKTDCECENNLDGTMTFKKIVVNGEIIFERGV